MEATAEYLFECSWEVCNKVGGIYTVVTSKAALMKSQYSKYFLIGPYIKAHEGIEFEKADAPPEIASALQELEREGIKTHFVKWFVKGEPNCILVEAGSLIGEKNDIKTKLYEHFKIDSMYSGWDFEEPTVWAWTVGKIIERLKHTLGDKKVVAHFHEWLAGAALLYLKLQEVQVGTVFTTHATMLGRTISGSNQPLYDLLDKINPEEEARKHGIQDKFLTEKACAENADAFTTVSEITALEAEKLLGKKPDVLVLNGLDIGRFPTFEETSIQHIKFRRKMRDFIKYFFFPHYQFDTRNSLNFFIVGRYEFKNKGIDIMIRALKQLNETLKAEESKKTIIVFFWIPHEVHGTKLELYQNKSTYDEIIHFVEDNHDDIQHNLIDNIIGVPIDSKMEGNAFDLCSGILNDDFMQEVRRLKANFKKPGNPLLVTHNLPNEENDAIIRAFKEHGLDNKEDDRVKVISYPIYLTGVDGLLNMAYYECIMACHLGLFPSYYEPWGYTPAETGALGVPALATDLGGFGRYVDKHSVGSSGIYVLKRMGVSDDDAVDEFADILHRFTNLTPKQRVQEKLHAKRTAEMADWKNFIEYYIEAHNLAMQKIGQ